MREVTRLLPSLTVGEYGPAADRPDDGGLYPLEEEGQYGAVPKLKSPGKWKPPQQYVPREKKPKVYASYNICECCVHGQEQEKRGGRVTTGSTTRRRESISSSVSTGSRNEG